MIFQYLLFTLTLSLIDFSSAQNVTTVQPAKNESRPASAFVGTPSNLIVAPVETRRPPSPTTAIPTVTTQRSVALTNSTAKTFSNATTEEIPGSGFGSIFSILSPLVPAQEIGSNCTSQTDCKINSSICLDGKCSCSEGFVVNWNNRDCLLRASALGDDCIEDVQCKISLEKSVGSVMCLSQKCGCGPDTKYVRTENKCVQTNGTTQIATLGIDCEADMSCTLPDSICTQNVCACKPSTLPSPENDRCIPATKKLGESCTDDAQCQEYLGDFSLCDDGSCNCKPNYHSDWNFTQCLEDKELGAACSRPDECMTHVDRQSGVSRDCVKGVCVCLSESCREQAGLKSTSSGVTNYFHISLLTVIFFNSFS